MIERWRIEGEYLESCNCGLLCPCLLGPRSERGVPAARPTEGHYNVPLVFAIEAGHYVDIRLEGTHAALAIYTPGAMAEGGWSVGVYVDERAAPSQRQALERIFGGRAGGAIGALWDMAANRLPTRTAAIDFGREKRRRWAHVAGVLEVEIEGIKGGDGESEVWLDNVKHIASNRLSAARAAQSFFRDHGFSWNHAGRNAHYARFEWAGP